MLHERHSYSTYWLWHRRTNQSIRSYTIFLFRMDAIQRRITRSSEKVDTGKFVCARQNCHQTRMSVSKENMTAGKMATACPTRRVCIFQEATKRKPYCFVERRNSRSGKKKTVDYRTKSERGSWTWALQVKNRIWNRKQNTKWNVEAKVARCVGSGLRNAMFMLNYVIHFKY